MGIFSSILAKLGFGGEDKAATAEAAPTEIQASTPAAPVAISVVDVMAKMESLASAHPEKLNWKVSIVDLLKLLGHHGIGPQGKKIARCMHRAILTGFELVSKPLA